MDFRYRSVALLCGLLLLGSCGEPDETASLPGPVQVDGSQFASAQEYLYTPGSVLETSSMRLDFINPKFDQGIPVRDSSSQGSGTARLTDMEARLLPLGDIPNVDDLNIDDSINSTTLSIEIADTIPPVEVEAFAPNDAVLSTQIFLNGLVLTANNANDQRLRVGTTFTGQIVDEEGEVVTVLTLRVERILVNSVGDPGSQVVIEGEADLFGLTVGVLNETTGDFENPDEGITAILNQGRFSASFLVRERGIQNDGGTEDPLALLARLHLTPNQAEVLFVGPGQVGSQSVLYAPDPTRANILPNQLVRIRRLLDGRIQAEFDPANISTVFNFVQVNPPPAAFPTPIPQLPPPAQPGAPTFFDYFFSLRTEREEEGGVPGPVVLQGIAPVTGNFIFRNLAGAQLGGPFNRAEISGAILRGNLNLVFSSTTSADDITGEFFVEQEFPTSNDEDDVGTDQEVEADDVTGRLLIIRGTFTGSEIAL